MANYFKKDIIFGIGILFVTLAVGLYIIALLYNYERAIEKEVEEVDEEDFIIDEELGEEWADD